MQVTQLTAVDTCAVVWWKGYVRGRFQAVVDTDPPTLAAESPPLRHRGPAPEPTPENVAAVDALAERLLEAGWERADEVGDEWFELRFTRPSQEPREDAATDPEAEAPADGASEEVVGTLRAQLDEARAAAERERRARLQAEARAPEPVVVRLPAPAATRAPRRTPPLLVALYALLVATTAAVFVVAFHSTYAAAAAALTIAAVCLGVDSWRVARRG